VFGRVTAAAGAVTFHIVVIHHKKFHIMKYTL
jgi:hypothetical protein